MLIEQGKDGRSPQETWPPEVVAFVASDIYSGLNCLAAWKVIPTNALQAIIDTIKTRVLNFTLTIEAEAPDAGEALPRTTPLPRERVSQVFHTYIAGDVQNVAAGGPVNQRASITNTPSEQVFRNLLAAVERAPAPPDEVEVMTAAIEDMEGSCGTADFGEKYLRFMSVLADHMQVFGPLVAPCLPALTRLAI